MKTTYELNTQELKIVLKLWMVSVGIPVLDSEQFKIDSNGNVTISIELPIQGELPTPVPPPVSPPTPVTPPPVTDNDRARCDKFSIGFTFPAECAYVHGSRNRIPEDVTYENVSGDNGGLTKWGIDAGGHPLLSADYIKNMTMQQALDQYYMTWTEQNCHLLPSPLAECVHDTYESGGHPIAWLQEVLGVTVDSQLGPITAAAAHASDPKASALSFLTHRDSYFMELADNVAHDAQFRQGWLNRDINLRKYLMLS